MFNKEELSNDRFPSEASHVIDLKETVKILNETMSLKKNFPHLKIATRDTFKEVIISDIYRESGHSIQLKYENSSWTVVDHQLPIPNAFEGIASCTNLIDSIRRYIIFLVLEKGKIFRELR
ncbi:CLUMA_CG004083, isoform A [Clunio marinus]|uniref:CLUMA_CG004083, isoform A n=1 Tax=Clunio marinus TaxID=568069 RepID=A0A1J1HQX7_9DIPT|nr:CLUMA_CG004083, isoform A [Clunio marinus]